MNYSYKRWLAIMKHKLAVILVLVSFVCDGYAQNNKPDLSKYASNNPGDVSFVREKIYVHLNKNLFLSGEIAWFRLYYLRANDNRPLTLSKIGYLELLDRHNHPVLQEKISLKNGEVHGSFVVPHTIPSGMYHLRVYTNWMKNFGEGEFFESSVRIINPAILYPDSNSQVKKQYDIQFFPEGGNLVQNIDSKVAYRITDAFGKGQLFTGYLMNGAGDTILEFRPSQFGIGHFSFSPEKGQRYHAVIRFPNGSQELKELPDCYPSGYVMSLSKISEDKTAIQIKVTPDIREQEVFLRIQNRNREERIKKSKIQNQIAVFTMDSDEFTDGISQITVCKENGSAVAERLYFKYPKENLSITPNLLSDYGKRKKIELTLTASERENQQVNADLSLSVYRIDSLQSVEEMDIQNYIYLVSELNGSIESPSFYFKNQKNSRDAIEDLMLTHGWRRIVWKEKSKKELMEWAPEFNGHFIQGKLIDNTTGKPVQKTRAYLSIPSLRTQFKPATSDSSGHIKFEMTDFYASQEIIVQLDPRDDSLGHFEISSPFSQNVTNSILPEFQSLPKDSKTLNDLNLYQQVMHVYDGPNINQFKMQSVDTNPFYSVPDEKYLLDDYTRFVTMEEVLREYVHSVNVVNRKNKLQLYAFDNDRRTFFDGYPLLLIDGVPFFDTNELFAQDPAKIKKIELVNREYLLGFSTFDGIINVSTYNGDLDGVEMSPRILIMDYPGIPEERQFFSPQYETELQTGSRIPDFRTALYWNPEIKVDKKEKTLVKFYSSDIPGKYAVVIQGISEDGIPGSQIEYFNINK